MSTEDMEPTLHLSISLRYPACWEIAITDWIAVGFLGYGIYTTGGDVATLFTIYGDDQEAIGRGIKAMDASELVHTVLEPVSGFQ